MHHRATNERCLKSEIATLRVSPCTDVRLIVPVNLHIRFRETMENVESTQASPNHSTVSM